MGIGFEDIYQHQFNSLYQVVKGLIGNSTISKPDENEEEANDSRSSLIFDVAGPDYKFFKAQESDFRYWVEVYVLKLIENMLLRKSIAFHERYHKGCKEQYSIVYTIGGKTIEAYFLFDLSYEEPNRSDYDIIAKTLKDNSQEAEEIHIFLFRDQIGISTLAWLVNGSTEFNENGFVKVFPLQTFFKSFFGEKEYSIFIQYAEDFHTKCNYIISYKTVITPTKKTMADFRALKRDMLRDYDYKAINASGVLGTLSDLEFGKISSSFLSNKMYCAMTSSNDFAESFISAEWSYDVYSKSMGELELTGIIAGYLKSVEQLLFMITRFHRDEGYDIKTIKEGYKEYTKAIEGIIDSTLGSLNRFVTSSKARLAISSKIRQSIFNAVDLWTKYQRNGYFHKHNLFSKDNKISEVRELTLYLYFLILGGIQFNSGERTQLGAIEVAENNDHCYDAVGVYDQFDEWFNDILKFDLPDTIPGIWGMIIRSDNEWRLKVYILNEFSLEKFHNDGFHYLSTILEMSHTKDIPYFSWNSNSDDIQGSLNMMLDCLNQYYQNNREVMKRINAIVIGGGRYEKLAYYDGRITQWH